MDLTAAPVVLGCAGLAVGAVVLVPATWDRRGGAVRRSAVRRSATVLLATVSVLLACFAAVNRQAGFFPTVGSLVSGSGATLTVGRDGVVQAVPAVPPLDLSLAQRARPDRGGAVVKVTIGGVASGVSRVGAVYLPAAYFDPGQAAVRFPVLEVLSGSPGSPAQTLHLLRLAGALDDAIRQHLMAPTVVVVPDTNGSAVRDRECVDAGHGVQDDTYLTADLQTWFGARFRTLPPGRGWGLLGTSTGGFCAVNLALRHPDRYAAAASLSGYFRPLTDLTTGRLYADRRQREANDPTRLVRRHPRVALWASAGTGELRELRELRAFVREVDGLGTGLAAGPADAAGVPGGVDLTSLVLPGAGHSFPAWRAVLPQALAWESSRLAGPAATPAPLRGQQLSVGRPW